MELHIFILLFSLVTSTSAAPTITTDDTLCCLVRDQLMLVARFHSCVGNSTNNAARWLYDICRAGKSSHYAPAPMEGPSPPIDTGKLLAIYSSCAVNMTNNATHWPYDTYRDLQALTTIGEPSQYAPAPTEGPSPPIDTGRLLAICSSCVLNQTNNATHWPYDTCRVWIHVRSAAPPPDVYLGMGQLCSHPSWRDDTHHWIREIGVFGLLLATNFLNWYVVIKYKVDDCYQSYMYLTCSILNTIPVFLYPARTYNVWECVKLASAGILSAVSIIADAGLYYEFGHVWVCMIFVVGEAVAALSVYHYGESASYMVHTISQTANSISAFILIACLLCKSRWYHVSEETIMAILNVIYTFFTFFDMCHTLHMVLVVVTFSLRLAYAILLTKREHTRGFLSTYFFGGNEGNDNSTRLSRSWHDICTLLRQNILSPLCRFSKMIWNAVRERCKSFWTNQIKPWVKDRLATPGEHEMGGMFTS